MKTYEYKGFTQSGTLQKGFVQALRPKHAREKLAGEGILVEKLSLSGRRKKNAFHSNDRSSIYRELGALLQAGMPLVAALDILIDSPEMSANAGSLAAVRDSVREGTSLADAFADNASLSGFERAIIQVGESSGRLDHVLVQVADFMEEQAKLKDRVQSALIYPCIVLTLGICVAIVMLGFLLPKTRSLMSVSDESMPGLTRFMMACGDAVIPWGLILMCVMAAAVIFFIKKVKKNADLRTKWDRRFFKMPLLGTGRTILVNLRFSRTLAILLRGGVSLVKGLSLAGKSTGSAWCEELLVNEADAVKHGESLSNAVRRVPPLSSVLPGWIKIGEATGALAELLDNAANRYQVQWDRFLSRAMAFLEPVLILLIGGFVLLITLSVLLPMFAMTNAVTGY